VPNSDKKQASFAIGKNGAGAIQSVAIGVTDLSLADAVDLEKGSKKARRPWESAARF
jgi:hypothetical protein